MLVCDNKYIYEIKGPIGVEPIKTGQGILAGFPNCPNCELVWLVLRKKGRKERIHTSNMAGRTLNNTNKKWSPQAQAGLVKAKSDLGDIINKRKTNSAFTSTIPKAGKVPTCICVCIGCIIFIEVNY